MNDWNPSFKTEGSYTPDMLLAGDHPVRTMGITLLAGQNLQRGALLGRVNPSGKYVLSVAATGDGSQVPTAILGEDTDASAGDRVTFAYVAGDFNTHQMTFGAGHTPTNTADGLLYRSIYLHTPING